MKDKFDREKEQTKNAIEKQQSGHAGTVEFQADFRTLPPMVLPLSALQTQIFDRISVGSRPIALLTTLAQVADGLNNAIMKRNQLIEYFKSKSLPSRQLLAMYFGFPFNEGQRNEEFSNSMEAIYAQDDDVVFFSSQLCQDMAS